MREYLVELGFKQYDIALLLLCPLGAVLGSIAHVLLQVMNPNRPPRLGSMRIVSAADVGRYAWIAGRLALGAILGLVIALYFIGALQENLTTLAKIVALSVLLGSAAPRLWIMQEKLVTDKAQEFLRQLLSESRSANTARSKETQTPGQSAETAGTDVAKR